MQTMKKRIYLMIACLLGLFPMQANVFGAPATVSFTWQIYNAGREIPASAIAVLPGYSCTIDWGDGTSGSETSHTYSATGTYEVTIYGEDELMCPVSALILNIFGVLITQIDVQKALQLRELNVSAPSYWLSVGIIHLDVSNNTALTSLDCSFNQLTNLDVSNNTALTSLDCSFNQLTHLDVSNNTALTVLNSGGNQLTNLDVSNNMALTSLTCGGKLTNLDVSNNTALTSLDCSYNQLTDLDVSNNTALKWLYCSYNQLTNLDVSNNTALTWLNCDNNQLTDLDLSNNTALTDLNCDNNQLTDLNLSSNTALTSLGCYDNQLTDLDVSNNTALVFLNCADNQLINLNVSNITALKDLYCYDNQLTNLDVSNNTALGLLDCYNNQLTDLDVSNNTALVFLNCNDNQLINLNVNNITALISLECNNNAIPLANLYAIAQNITQNNHMGFISLGSQSLPNLNVLSNTPIAIDTVFHGINTVFDVSSGVLGTDYTLDNGTITFLTAGSYTVTINNPAILNGKVKQTFIFTPMIYVTDVSLDQTTASLSVNDILQLTATVLPDSATNKNVTWVSDNPTIANVDSTGKVSALAAGTATITVTTEDGGFSASCVVTVNRVLSSDATLSGITVSAGVLSPAFSPSVTQYTVEAGNEITSINLSATANNAAATVSGTGTKSLSVGYNVFNITVTAENGSQLIYSITVNRAAPSTIPVTGVTLDNSSASLWVSETQQLTVTVVPADATNQNVSWISSAPSVATVSNSGLITAISKGTATITATTEDGGYKATCAVNVQQQEVTVPDSTQTGTDGKGTITLSLTIPADVLFSGSFQLVLPNGVQLDLSVTHLVGDLATQLTLNIVQNADGSWTFTITPTGLRSATEMVYSQIMQIGYTVDNTVAAGTYNASINDLSFTFDNGATITESEIPVQLTVSSQTGISDVTAKTDSYLYNGRLYVDSPVAERITVYSEAGVALYNFNKQAGSVSYSIETPKGSVLIVKGGSGWVRKAIR